MVWYSDVRGAAEEGGASSAAPTWTLFFAFPFGFWGLLASLPITPPPSLASFCVLLSCFKYFVWEGTNQLPNAALCPCPSSEGFRWREFSLVMACWQWNSNRGSEKAKQQTHWGLHQHFDTAKIHRWWQLKMNIFKFFTEAEKQISYHYNGWRAKNWVIYNPFFHTYISETDINIKT